LEGTITITERLALVRRKKILILGMLGLALVAAVVIAVALGAVYVPVFTTAKIIASRLPLIGRLTHGTWDATQETVILSVRLPRVLLALLVGMALALAGAIFQGLFRNPMADPSFVGSAQGAALGATIAFFFGIKIGIGKLSTVPLFAFAGSLLAIAIVYLITRTGGRVSVASLLLVGIAFSSFLASIVSTLMVISKDRLHNIFFWLMGGVAGANWDMVLAVIPFILIGSIVTVFFAKDLNLLMLGEERASQLGLEAERFKWIMLVITSLVVGAAVSVSGIIGFVGLMTPHIVRLLTGPDHRYLIPGSLLAGGLFLVLADTMARLVMAPSELPLGIVTAFFGAPFFIYLLKRRKNVLA
jgi:iron complex transport system permease protein